jgi:hypothetical protein
VWFGGTRPPEIGHNKHECHKDQDSQSIEEAVRVHLEESELGRAREMSNQSRGLLFAKLLPNTFNATETI